MFKICINITGGLVSGSLSRQIDESHYLKSYLDYESHTEKIGKLVEITENNIRNQIEEVYIKKTSEILNKLRTTNCMNKNNPVLSNNLAELFNKR